MTGNGQRQTVAVVGLGSIGGIAAACLAEAGRHDVIGCARKPIDKLTLERPGRTVTPPLPVITDPAEATPADWVLVVTKTQDTAGLNCPDAARAVTTSNATTRPPLAQRICSTL